MTMPLETQGRAGNPERLRSYAKPVEFEPNVIFAIGSTTLAPLEKATSTVPIVFTLTADPLGGGFVENLARSGGNAIAEDADV